MSETKDLILRARTLAKRTSDVVAGIKSPSRPGVSAPVHEAGRIIFGVDATASRSECWNQTKLLQADMFFAVEKTGANLGVQLCYYFGDSFVSGTWLNEASDLATIMAQVHCVSGTTQIEKLFHHAIDESKKKKIDALIFVGDSCEENESKLINSAFRLNGSKIRLFMFHDEMTMNGRPGASRNENTGSIFRAIAKAADGKYAAFDSNSPDTLQDYLKTVAIYSTGNQEELKKLPHLVKTEQGRKFLNEVLRLPPPHP